MRVVVEHLRGKRRGERQVFEDPERIRFGRHPESEVAFDPDRDLDASSRHAELARTETGYVLRDVGSSNGTFAEGELVHEISLGAGAPLVVDLGAAGPRVRLCLGEDAGDRPDPRPHERDATARRSSAPRGLWLGAAAAALALALWLVL